MFEAQYLKTGATLYSPWFPRGGDFAMFTGEIAALGSGSSLKITVVQKNSEDVGDGSPITTPTIDLDSATKIDTVKFDAGFKELVRYKFEVSGQGGWVYFRMLPPVWYDGLNAAG